MTNLKLTTYQTEAASTANDAMKPGLRLAVASLGLAGEAGEVADHIKKHLGHGHDLDQPSLVKEMGDVLWYLAELCTVLEIDLSEVAGQNLAKLANRYPAGFDQERSKKRNDPVAAMIHILESADRMGKEIDNPEGAKYIQISDTLAKMMVKALDGRRTD